jgi:hypothetical protein
VNKPEAAVKSEIPNEFRRLKPNEQVSVGDYVANGHQGFELWEGPGGFRAGSFVKPIYRRTTVVRLQPRIPDDRGNEEGADPTGP